MRSSVGMNTIREELYRLEDINKTFYLEKRQNRKVKQNKKNAALETVFLKLLCLH